MVNRNNIHVLSRGVVIDRDHILLCKTLDLPINFYFLPGGHVEHGESVETSLLREFVEEAGADCHIQRFLGCLEYSFEPGHNSICHNHEYNFIFEITSNALTFEKPIPRLEDHIELLWVPLSNLSALDFRPEPLKTLVPQWLQSEPTEIFKSVMV